MTLAAVVGALVAAFTLAATVTHHLAVREPAPRPAGPHHLKPARRHHAEPRHEWLSWTVSLVVRWYRYEDGGPKSGLILASLFLAFSVLIGASQ